jgi:hypothetical protein
VTWPCSNHLFAERKQVPNYSDRRTADSYVTIVGIAEHSIDLLGLHCYRVMIESLHFMDSLDLGTVIASNYLLNVILY